MKKLMIVPIVALGMLFTTNVNAQVEDDMKKAPTEAADLQKEYQKINKSELPEPVTAAVARDFKGSMIAEAHKAEDNTYKLVLVSKEGEKAIVYANAEGKWIKPNRS